MLARLQISVSARSDCFAWAKRNSPALYSGELVMSLGSFFDWFLEGVEVLEVFEEDPYFEFEFVILMSFPFLDVVQPMDPIEEAYHKVAKYLRNSLVYKKIFWCDIFRQNFPTKFRCFHLRFGYPAGFLLPSPSLSDFFQLVGWTGRWAGGRKERGSQR